MAERRRTRRDDPVVEVTTAHVSRSEEIAARERRYVVSMLIRTGCFIGAYFAYPSWFTWVLIAASFLLPYVAVVAANARHSLPAGDPEAPDADLSRRTLGPGGSGGAPLG